MVSKFWIKFMFQRNENRFIFLVLKVTQEETIQLLQVLFKFMKN